MHTAALVLIGSELIPGGIADENRAYLAQQLHSVGVKVVSAHMVRDEIDPAADLIRFLYVRAYYVITVGGLGPTLDDVTLEAVALAFDKTLVEREPDSATAYAEMSGSETIHPLLRRLPAGSEIVPTDHGPIVRTDNVYSLPGLPTLVRARFPTLARKLGTGATHYRTKSFKLPQSRISRTLQEAGRKYPTVSIGCYPSSETRNGTAIAVEGADKADVDHCFAFVDSEISNEAADSVIR